MTESSAFSLAEDLLFAEVLSFEEILHARTLLFAWVLLDLIQALFVRRLGPRPSGLIESLLEEFVNEELSVTLVNCRASDAALAHTQFFVTVNHLT